MEFRKIRYVLFSLLTGLLLGSGVVAGLSAAVPEIGYAPSDAVSREYDPVILKGAQLNAQLDPPIDELVLYRYQGTGWSPIPYQIDKVDLTGTLVLTGDGKLQTQDELVWMAWDGGDQAPPGDWPVDPFARLNPRIEIRFTDPLSSGDESWVYLFRSPTLPRANNAYVSWDPPSQTATTISYTLAFNYENFFGIADMTINGTGVDLLDRQKVRISLGFFDLNEEDLASVITAPLQFSAIGPVRLATGSGTQRLSIFGRSFGSTVSIDTSEVFTPTSIRTSLDLNNPAQTGLDMYLDSNTPGGVMIDGVQDAVPSSPLISWYQVNGDASGPGGLVVIFDDIDAAGGSVENFYLDDVNANDPGDGAAYGDAGVYIADPGPVIRLSQAMFVLPPGTSTSMGMGLLDQFHNQLETDQTIQSLAAPEQIFLPVVRRE